MTTITEIPWKVMWLLGDALALILRLHRCEACNDWMFPWQERGLGLWDGLHDKCMPG